MPIDTKIDGNPESIRSAARWMRATLSVGIYDCTTQIYAARTRSEAEWVGAAGDRFRDRMTGGGRKADDLAADVEAAGLSFETFADDLQTAQIRMGRARQIAADGGLVLTDTQILDPGPAPADPGRLAPDASPEETAAHQSAAYALSAHACQVAAYVDAQIEASSARAGYEFAKRVRRYTWD